MEEFQELANLALNVPKLCRDSPIKQVKAYELVETALEALGKRFGNADNLDTSTEFGEAVDLVDGVVIGVAVMCPADN